MVTAMITFYVTVRKYFPLKVTAPSDCPDAALKAGVAVADWTGSDNCDIEQVSFIDDKSIPCDGIKMYVNHYGTWEPCD